MATAGLEGHIPLRSPPAVPKVLRLELMILDTYCEGDLAALRLAEHGTDTVPVVIGCVGQRLNIQGRPPRLSRCVWLIVLEVDRLLAQVIIFEGLLGAWIIEAAPT